MKTWTLQVRITAIVGVILLAACLLLTTNSLFAAHTYYGDYAALIESGLVEPDPALTGDTEISPSMVPIGESYYEATQKFSTQSVMAMALIVTVALACSYFAAGHVLQPLQRLTKSVREVDDLHLDRRVATQGVQGEMLELTESFNGMLDRLEDSFLIQKTFAANAAHELKTPLAVIKSSLQVLEMAPHPAETDYREFMADTGESLERIIKTVEGLLSLANLESAPMDEAIELRPLLDQAVRELSGNAAELGVTLSVSGQAAAVRGNSGQEAAVRGNSGLLYRAVFNLIENAIKYNRPGGTVQIALTQTEDAVSVRVEDTGLGIPEKALPHIFEPFYRADPSRSQQIPGSGLGLAMVKMIVERHGGEIEASSQEAAGSAFTVTLKRQLFSFR